MVLSLEGDIICSLMSKANTIFNFSENFSENVLFLTVEGGRIIPINPTP